MAFCGNCGTQLNDGAKFCPKCGQPTSEVSNVQNQSANSNFDSEPEEQIKTWQKIVCVLFWPIGAIITIAAFLKKQHALAKSALLYTAIGIALAIVISIAGNKEEGSGTSTKTENITSVDVDEKDKQTEQKQEPIRQEQEEPKKSPSFIGTYEVTDKAGCTIRITINEDKTATITGVRGEGKTYYCTWSDFSHSRAGLGISFSSERPLLYFEGGDNAGKGVYSFIKDGWFYPSISTAQANNQDWRLPVKKVN